MSAASTKKYDRRASPLLANHDESHQQRCQDHGPATNRHLLKPSLFKTQNKNMSKHPQHYQKLVV